MEREKTNSITHLVKIVATEVYQELFKEITGHRVANMTNRINELEDRIDDLEDDTASARMMEAVKNSLENRGDMWNKVEDKLLVDEVNMAIRTIAKNHGRTDLAIKMRIRDKGLM